MWRSLAAPAGQTTDSGFGKDALLLLQVRRPTVGVRKMLLLQVRRSTVGVGKTSCYSYRSDDRQWVWGRSPVTPTGQTTDSGCGEDVTPTGQTIDSGCGEDVLLLTLLG